MIRRLDRWAFKSSRGRELGKENIYHKSANLGLGYGGGGGGSTPLTITGMG